MMGDVNQDPKDEITETILPDDVVSEPETKETNEFADLATDFEGDDGLTVPVDEMADDEASEESGSLDDSDKPTVEEGDEPKPAVSDETTPEVDDSKAKAEDETPDVTPESDTKIEPQVPEVEQPTFDLEAFKKQYSDQRGKAHNELVQHFSINEEDAGLLQTEPDKVLPKLAANLYLDVFEAVVKTVQGMMPSQVQNVMQTQTVNQKNETDFFGAWNKLDRGNAEHTNMLTRIGTAYRQLNPQATKEQFIQEVGAQAMVALRIPLEADAPSTVAPAPAPHRPAAPAAHSQPAAKGKELNEYEQLANELLEDDRS